MGNRRKKTSLRGRFLLDGGKLQGSAFHRTVVLICQHDDEGAFGLVLNRLAEVRVGDALEGDLPPALGDLKLRLGGPVQPGALSYLHCRPGTKEGSVLPGIDLGHALEQLLELGATDAVRGGLLVFAGYAGWSPGQLDGEIERDAWLVLPATLEAVLDPDPATLWKRLLGGLGGRYRLLAEAPDDLTTN